MGVGDWVERAEKANFEGEGERAGMGEWAAGFGVGG